MITALIIEALVRLTAAAIRINCVPFRLLAPNLGGVRKESPASISDATEHSVRQITRALSVASSRLPFDCSCLAQAVAAKAMLRRRGIASTLYLGVNPQSVDALWAHAWLRCGPILVTGADGSEQCVPVVTFAESVATATGDRE